MEGIPMRFIRSGGHRAPRTGLRNRHSDWSIRRMPPRSVSRIFWHAHEPAEDLGGDLRAPQTDGTRGFSDAIPAARGKPRRWRPAPTPWRRETPVARATWPASGLDVGDRDMVGPSLDLTSLNRCTALDREPTGVLRHRNDGVVELIHGLSWVATELGYQTCHGRGFQACPHRRGL